MIDVVIIDDEVWVARLISQMIDWEAMGFRIVEVFHDGIDGYNAVRKMRPKLVFTDIRMPGMTGLDIIQELSSVSDSLFVIISGYNDFEYAKTALTHGVIGYLLKPLDAHELKKVVIKAKDLILRDENRKHTEHQIRISMSHALEKLREQVFSSLFEGLTQTYDLEGINADLRLKFCKGVFQVVGLIQRADDNNLLEAIGRAIWEVSLPSDCYEIVSLSFSEEKIMILNYHEMKKTEVEKALERVFKLLIDNKIFNNFAMGVGIVVNDIGDIRISYQSATEMELAGLLLGKPGIYYAQKYPLQKIERQQLISGLDVNLKRAFTSLSTSTVNKLSNDSVDELYIKSKKNPSLFMQGIRYLLESYMDNTPMEMESRNEYFVNIRRKICASLSIIEIKKILACATEDIIKSRGAMDIAIGKSATDEALRFIDNYYMQDICLVSVADIVHLNPNYLSGVFKKETGINFSDYLTNKRIDAAKNLLKTSDYKLVDVAEMVGYNNVKHFAKTFKKIAGISPAEYRKLTVGNG